MGLYFPTGIWTSRHSIPMDTPRKQKLQKILLSTLQGIAVTLWEVFNESFEHHLLQFHCFTWNKPGQVRGEQPGFPSALLSISIISVAHLMWWKGSLSVPNPTHTHPYFWVCFTMQAQELQKDTPRTGRTSDKNNCFQQELLLRTA